MWRRRGGAWSAVLATFGAALLCGAIAHAVPQEAATGEVRGTVVDGAGSKLAGQTVTLDGKRLAAPREMKTEYPSGVFSFSALPAGTYFLRIKVPGLWTVTRENIVVSAGGHVGMNIEMKIAPAGLDLNNYSVSSALTAAEVEVAVQTLRGDIVIAVDTVHAPITSANFLKYVDGGFYNQGRVHRVTRPDNYTPTPPNRPLMEIIQAGPDPFRWRDAFSPIPLERTSLTGLKHVVGTVSMARGNDADTATSDFFICLDDQPSLDFGGKRFDDGQGAGAFGRVLYGMDVVRNIQQEKPLRSAPNQQYLETPIVILRASRISR